MEIEFIEFEIVTRDNGIFCKVSFNMKLSYGKNSANAYYELFVSDKDEKIINDEESVIIWEKSKFAEISCENCDLIFTLDETFVKLFSEIREYYSELTNSGKNRYEINRELTKRYMGKNKLATW